MTGPLPVSFVAICALLTRILRAAEIAEYHIYTLA